MKNIFILLFFLLLLACQKDEHINPYDNVQVEEETIEEVEDLDPTSLEGLHASVFRPTCANSGCHDGTFEPDFRTINSTYNTLINQPIIKNDPQGSYTYRVIPGNSQQSQLMARLTVDIDGQSGIMPLVTEPDSDWPEKANDYIDNIKTWIDAGAQK